MRINKLEKQLARKNQQIQKMKVKKWTRPARAAESAAFRSLNEKVAAKQWVDALEESRRLKKLYPKSLRLTKMRAQIFAKMGLRKQAKHEVKIFRNLKANRNGKTKTRR